MHATYHLNLVTSWFPTLVDCTELGPFYFIQLKQLRYAYLEDEGATMAIRKDCGLWLISRKKKCSCTHTACCNRGSLADSPLFWNSNHDLFAFFEIHNFTTTARESLSWEFTYLWLGKKVWSDFHFRFRNCDLKPNLHWSIQKLHYRSEPAVM